MSAPVKYIERTRAWYLALGYETPYEWASNRKIPFHRLTKPLSSARVALVTTAALYDPAKGDQGPGAPYNGAAKFMTPYSESVLAEPDTRISHIAYDRKHTTATDQNSWFPLEALHNAADSRLIGSVAPHFHGAPTNRSQRTTLTVDAPLLLEALLQDNADAAILVANCPVCHQSTTLIARHLESHGISTVVMGCAKDIVERAGAPRFVFSDFPLGNAAGKPHDRRSQRETLALALDALESANSPLTIVNSERWDADDHWKLDYSNPELLSSEELESKRADFDEQKRRAREKT